MEKPMKMLWFWAFNSIRKAIRSCSDRQAPPMGPNCDNKTITFQMVFMLQWMWFVLVWRWSNLKVSLSLSCSSHCAQWLTYTILFSSLPLWHFCEVNLLVFPNETHTCNVNGVCSLPAIELCTYFWVFKMAQFLNWCNERCSFDNFVNLRCYAARAIKSYSSLHCKAYIQLNLDLKPEQSQLNLSFNHWRRFL